MKLYSWFYILLEIVDQDLLIGWITFLSPNLKLLTVEHILANCSLAKNITISRLSDRYKKDGNIFDNMSNLLGYVLKAIPKNPPLIPGNGGVSMSDTMQTGRQQWRMGSVQLSHRDTVHTDL